MKRREFMSLGGAALSAPAVMARRPSSKRPNILLLMADQLRGDCVGADGNKDIQTPNLDRLASEGARFRCAYSSTPSCTPARAALLTGLSPWHHGMLGYGRVAEHYPVEMPRSLAQAGYYTEVIGKCHYYPQRNVHGFEQALLDESGRVETPDFRSDYRSWFWSVAPDLNPDKTGLSWNDYRGAPYALPEELHPTHWIGETAVRFLRKYQRPEPFFLKVSFERPHSPYDPPQRFWKQYQDRDLPRAQAGEWAKRYAPRSGPGYEIWHGDLGEQQVRESRQGYYGNVSFVDEQIGRILEILEQRKLLDETLIVFLSDHGDMTGDQHLWRKCYAYEPSARIATLLRWPSGLAAAKRGQVLSQPIEIRDILPTLLDAAGAPPPDTKLDGQSLLELVRGGAKWREYIDLEHDVCYSPENHWNALTDGRQKYIFHAQNGEEQLFDLVNDPYELHDLAAEPTRAKALLLWRRRLTNHLAERGDQFVKNGKLVLRTKSLLYSPNYPGRTGRSPVGR
ncbi:MAG TPA: arylsulfatase [Bryobacteraceae bacterium]|nr:arylsulfatase [Bryobacteraceae bacterium]